MLFLMSASFNIELNHTTGGRQEIIAVKIEYTSIYVTTKQKWLSATAKIYDVL